MSERPSADRIVKPRRKHAADPLPIIAVCFEDECVLSEVTGEILPLSVLPSVLQASPPSMVVVQNAARLLKDLDELWGADETWQFRVTPDKREIHNPTKPGTRRAIVGTVVGFFGWKAPGGAHKKGRYHYPLDPTIFARKPIGELLPGPAPRVVKLLQWGADVRDWMAEQELRPSPTNGGVAGQLLRDSRWFPEPRRKVPRATNARARATLPGNHYRLYVPEGRSHQAYYLDMRASHHHMAERLEFPCPDDLFARGRFRVTDDADVTATDNGPWARNGSRLHDLLTTEARGLLYCHLTVPTMSEDRFPLPYAERAGLKMAWVYTNEVQHLRESGVVIDWITAALCSFKTDNGMNRYARWALDSLDAVAEDRKRWLKPTLLSTYGLLAARPRLTEVAFKRATGGVTKRYPAGSGMLECVARISDTSQETPIANVIYRGMIEAEQRVESLRMARFLHGHGLRVLAVYADSVFVESGQALPFLPHPWQIEHELDGLLFWAPTAFTSAQVTKLPGIPREARLRHELIQRMRAASTNV